MPTIYAIQFNPVWEDKQANFDRVNTMIDGHRFKPGSLVVLPEMFATGFAMNPQVTAKDEPDLTLNYLKEIAAKHNVYVMAGMVEPGDGGKGRNVSVTVNPEGERVCRYQKIQPISLSGEPDCHEAGNEVVTFSWGQFTVSPYICYDLRFPEWFRKGADLGATLYIVIASWPDARIQHWIKLLQARAIENQAYVVGVNRYGEDPNAFMPGRSLVVDPLGNILADAGEEETIIQAEVEIDIVNQFRSDLPFLRDRRQEVQLQV